MKRFFRAAAALSAVIISASAVLAWEAGGVIPGAEIEYSGLAVSKSGVSVRLANTSGYDVRVSLKLTFFDGYGNSIGHSVFGLREISAGEPVEISGNYLSGKWKECRDAAKISFVKMTYEPIYE